MVEYVFNKAERLNEASYQKYLDNLKISTEFYRGDCPLCSETFKIKPLPFDRVDEMIKYPSIHCPYCGHHNYYDRFFKSDYPPLQLDTTRKCNCGLTYAITGVTVICPNCVIFNSRQLFLEQMTKIKSLVAANNDWENLGDCLSKLVSQFDGYGRATICFQYFTSIIPSSVKAISFQNLEGANKNLQREFGITIKEFVSTNEWSMLYKYFQRRHLIAHALGVTNQDYIDKTADASVKVGQRIPLDQTELTSAINICTEIAVKLYGHLAS